MLVGDLNATPGWPVYHRLVARLHDAALQVAARSGTRPEPTWGLRSDSTRWLRIDHALVSGVEVDALRVVDVPGSDHSALVIDITGVGPESEATPDSIPPRR
jgi:endonuclease/exonuclease/phosphatase family metal-dependent hydrolase